MSSFFERFAYFVVDDVSGFQKLLKEVEAVE